MTDYSLGSARLQNPLVDTLASWGVPQGNGFNMDPLSSSFGNYGAIEAPSAGSGFGGGFSLGSGNSGSALGSVFGPADGLSQVSGQDGGGGLLGSFFDKSVGGVTTQGWGGMALGAISALGNAYMGMKQYGLAKDTLKHNKEMFAKNFDAQKRTTNASLEDRQRARIASNAGAYESVGSYMDKNGIR